ncbi:asparagine synthase-related protein [Peribacillus muralis]|uniref:asparagine synthase-related protein n=1 Tax=Peribacillus muralis TaxID=264697 RepID=UPI003828DA67
MSAIAGLYHLNQEQINLHHGETLMKSLLKFPADSIQVWNDEHMLLGCHNQWITPESVNETLPFYDYDRQLAITADAIIDNREELFERLQIKNFDRPILTDSQLILLAYHKWGEETPKYLVGDFVFMIWDQKNRKLFGARDFSGSRTLYYFKNDDKLAFCTTIGPLLTLPYIEKKLNEEWLAEFLAIPINVESVDPSSTVYQDIKQIPPSHSMKIIDGRVTFSRYSFIKKQEELKLKTDMEYEEAFRDVYDKVVKSKLRSNYQIGSHLSGGLDSGSVVSFAAKALERKKQQLYTYSYVPVKDFVDWTPRSRVADERPFISSTVEYVGNIKAHYMDFKEKSPFSEVDDWLDVLEMPYKYYENSYWLKGIYEHAAKENIRVLLNGQRGNWTISWGHALDYQASLLKQLKWIHLFKELHLYSENLGVKKSRIMAAVRKKAFPSLYRLMAAAEEPYPMLIKPEFAERTKVFTKLHEHKIDVKGVIRTNVFTMKDTQFQQLYYWNINGNISTKLSLRHAIAERDPTNDLRIIQFCNSIPESQYVLNGQDRSLIRRATKGYLPDNVRLNNKTRGIQGSDGIHRMAASWHSFMEEMQFLSKDDFMAEFINMEEVRKALTSIEQNPHPEKVFDDDFRVLMRTLIVSRFIKKNFEGR